MKKEAAEEPEPETTPAQPWQVALKKMEVTNWELAFEDRTLTHPSKAVNRQHRCGRGKSNQ
jgi:hypothetical protein